MDIKKFRVLREEYGPGHSSKHIRHGVLWDGLLEAAAPEHIHEPKSRGFHDTVTCSCGWESPGYWDLMEAALDDWVEHVARKMGLVPEQCICGRRYLPADGQTACHEVVPTGKQ